MPSSNDIKRAHRRLTANDKPRGHEEADTMAGWLEFLRGRPGYTHVSAEADWLPVAAYAEEWKVAPGTCMFVADYMKARQ